MAEEKKTALTEKEKAKKLRDDFNLVGEYGARWLEKDRARKGTYTKEKQRQLDEAEKKAKAVTGLKAKNTHTLTQNGVKLILVKGYPVSDYFSGLFNKDQKEQYFTK